MGSRHRAREWAVQLLFENDFNPNSPDEALPQFWTLRDPAPTGKEFTESLYLGVLEHKDDIDCLLEQYADNWGLKRMSAVDRNIMRVAIFEMLHRADIPPVVTINEAVELAKAFGGSDSGGFVNGILDRARKDIDRPARTAAEE